MAVLSKYSRNIISFGKKKLDSNINIWVFNYSIDWKFDTNNSINNKYLNKIDDKLSRSHKIWWKYNIILTLKNVKSLSEIRTYVETAKVEKVDYYLYWDISTIDCSKWIYKVTNEFKSINDNDFLVNSLEKDEDYSRINIYDQVELELNKNDIDVTKLLDNIVPLMELNFSSNENNFIKNLWLKSTDLNSDKYSWYLSLWKWLWWIDKYNKKKNELSDAERINLLMQIEANLKVAKDECKNKPKYLSIINNEIIKFFSKFDDEKKYKRIVKESYKENIDALKWTDEYTDERFSYFHYRFFNFIEMKNPLSLLSLEWELDLLKERWLSYHQKVYYLYYKINFLYAKYLLGRIDYWKFIEDSEKKYSKVLELIKSQKTYWAKFFGIKKILAFSNYQCMSLDSIKLLCWLPQLDLYLEKKGYLKKEINFFCWYFIDSDFNLFSSFFLKFLNKGEYNVIPINSFFKSILDRDDWSFEDELSLEEKKRRDILYSRLFKNKEINIDIYESRNSFDYIYFWLIRYKKLWPLHLSKIDACIKEKSHNLEDLFNISLILLLNREYKKFDMVMTLIDKNLFSLWTHNNLFILNAISILFYELKSSEQSIDNKKRLKIIYLIIRFAEYMPQLWNQYFIRDIYNKYIYDETNDFQINEVKDIRNEISNEIELINISDSERDYSMYLDINLFNINLKKRNLFRKISNFLKHKIKLLK